MRSGGPHAEPPPPASIFRFFMRLSFPMRFRGLPTHGPPPHTVSRFPHTATRLTHFPIRFSRSPWPAISPYVFRGSTIQSASSKESKSGETSDGGGAGTSCMYAYICMYAHFCTGMRAPVRPWAYLHGHGRISMARFHGHIPMACLHFDPHASGHSTAETSGRSPQITNRFRHASSLSQRPVHSNLRIQPVYSNFPVQPLGGMDDDAASASTSTTTGGGAAPACVIGPKGQPA